MKELFKFTKTKTILFIIIFLILPIRLTFLVPLEELAFQQTFIPFGGAYILFLTAFWLWSVFIDLINGQFLQTDSPLGLGYEGVGGWKVYIIIMLYLVIISFVLSNLIIFAYKKFKRD